jgi:beta-N-acetylhexosaminidase
VAYAVTLLRDQGGLLPLDPNRAVTVIYPLDFFGVPDIFRVYDPDVRAIGVTYAVSPAERSQALAAAEEGEQIVMLTLDVSRFPGQGELVRALPAGQTVVAAIRSPFDVLAFPSVNTYLLTYSGNDYALDALARVLYGRLGAQGRLPVEIAGAAPGDDG